jgi:hypothetical protein
VIWEDIETSHNNWRGALGGFTGWATAGAKHLATHDGHYARWVAAKNRARGFWFDFDVRDVTFDDLRSYENAEDGVFLEAIQGPISFSNSLFRDNARRGLITGAVERLTLRDTVITHNGESELRIDGASTGRTVWDFELQREQVVMQCSDWIIDRLTLRGSDTIQDDNVPGGINGCPNISITGLIETGPALAPPVLISE